MTSYCTIWYIKYGRKSISRTNKTLILILSCLTFSKYAYENSYPKIKESRIYKKMSCSFKIADQLVKSVKKKGKGEHKVMKAKFYQKCIIHDTFMKHKSRSLQLEFALKRHWCHLKTGLVDEVNAYSTLIQSIVMCMWSDFHLRTR